MKRSEAPKKQPVPFAINGLREELLPATQAGDNTASYLNGFPPITMTLKTAGGLPPKGQDMNQILFEVSALARWASSGAINSFDQDFATSIGGYPKGATLIGDDGSTIFISSIDDNTSNPNSGGAGWFNQTNGYLKTASNLSEIRSAGTDAQNSAKINLGLQSFGTSAGFTSVSSPTAKTFIYITDAGDWGVQDSFGTPIPLTIARGGTGASTTTGARSALGVSAFASSSSFTSMSSPTAKTFIYITDAGDWGAQDSSGTPIPLTINRGGTGSNTLSGARFNLGVNAFATSSSFSSMSSPNATRALVITDAGDWGVQDSTGNVTALSISRGGTGAKDASTARTNLGLGVAATRNVGSLAGQIPDMSLFLASATGKGYFKLPSGMIFQWGSINVAAANSSADVSIDQCQIPFPNGVLQAGASGSSTLTDTPCFASAEAISNQQIRIKAVAVNLTNKTITQGQVVPVTWWAIGA